MSEPIIITARKMFDNGFMPIPLVPGGKAIKVLEWSVKADRRDFAALWNNAPAHSNIGSYAGENVITIDFDNHGPEPNGLTVYNKLVSESPGIFEGAIVERTPSNGIHASYYYEPDIVKRASDGAKGRAYTILKVNEIEISNELYIGSSQTACPPSVTDKGAYEYVSSNTHLNTKRSDLPTLPDIFRHGNKLYVDYKAKESTRPRDMIAVKDLTYEDLDSIISGLVNAYSRKAHKGTRHDQALGMACNMAGISVLSDYDIYRAIEDFFRASSPRREPEPGEIDGMIAYARRNASHDPAIPWKTVITERSNKRLRKLVGC